MEKNITNTESKIEKRLNLAILTMQKIEDLLLEPWIQYYAKLMPYENICIVDNNSTNEKVIEILKIYEKKGVKVYYEYNRPQDFEAKGPILKDLAQKLYSNCDFVFFFDADEFIYLNIDDGKYDAEDIHNYLLTLPKKDNSIYELSKTIINVPYKQNYYSKYDNHIKVFFRGGTVKDLCTGFHNGNWSIKSEKIKTYFATVHFHNKPYNKIVEAAKEKMKLRVDVNDKEAIKNYNGRGIHLVYTLLVKEEEYHKRFEKLTEFMHNTNFRDKLKEYNIDIPF